MPVPQTESRGWEPARPTLIALLVYLVPVAVLFWPLTAGKFLGGLLSDQYSAGFSFRNFGAEYFLQHGGIPQWNPYLFGGMPYIGAMHGDIFYPTAWLRWIMPVGTAMGVGFALHILLAGLFTYLLVRALRFSWTAALVGGMAYELSGIVLSMVHPGHDGKLFVSALTPLLLWALVRAIRDARPWAYGAIALTVGLIILTPHPPMALYAFMAAAIFGAYLLFLDPERNAARSRGQILGLVLGSVAIGVAIAAVQILPVYHYLPYSTRAVGHSASSYAYATAYALPPAELIGTVLPQFNGIGMLYWGENFFKLHSEYLGAVVVALAIIGLVARRRDRALLTLGVIGALFLLVSLGGHTPFYKLWYEVVPYIKKVRAPGMAFFLVALPVSVWAGAGVEAILSRSVSVRPVAILFGVLALVGLLAAAGGLQPLAQNLADPRMASQVEANAPELVAGGFRLLIVALLGGLAVWLVLTSRAKGMLAALALTLVVGGDLFSVEKQYVVFAAPAEQLFARDPITSYLADQPQPLRVFDAPGESAYQIRPVYPGDFLMAQGIPVVFGYHGNEEFAYDELWGGKNVYQHMTSGNLWDLWSVNYVVLGAEQALPGFHKVVGPAVTTPGDSAVLYQRDQPSPYARVVPGAVKIPEAQLIPTLLQPRFPTDLVVLLPDSAEVTPAPLHNALPAPTPIRARVTAWEPGAMEIALDSADSRPTWLVIAESFYPDWQASVDGKGTPVVRGNAAQLTVALPPGAREVRLTFRGAGYRTGKILTFAGTLLALVMLLVPLARRRPVPA